jgi:hypothetical protein
MGRHRLDSIASPASDETASVRGHVRPDRRARFDELLAEARFIDRLRDARGLFSGLRAKRLLRRAILVRLDAPPVRPLRF